MNAAPGPAMSLRLATLMAALPPLFWAGNFLVARIMHEAIPPIQMSFWRWLLALVILLPFVMRGVITHRHLLRKEAGFLLLLGAIGVTAFNCLIYTALHHTTVVNAALINSLMPVATILFAFMLLGDRIGPRQAGGIALAILGALLIIARGDPSGLLRLELNRGDLLVLAGLMFWAGYTVLIRWRPTGLPLPVFLAAIIATGALFHLPFMAWELATRGGFSVGTGEIAALVYFAVFPSILAYIFWNRAVATLGPGRTGTFMYLMPIFSAILGVTLLGEAFRGFHALGFLLIVIGIALVTRQGVKPGVKPAVNPGAKPES